MLGMEVLGASSGLATFRPSYCLCFRRGEPHARFIVRSRCLSATSLPLSFRVQIQFHSWSKQLFRIIPKAQLDESNGDVSSADRSQREVRREKALERLDEQLLEGLKPLYVEYLMGLGFDLDDIRKIVGRYPCIRHRSVDGEIRPFVEGLQNVGVDHKGLLVILRRYPEAVAVNIEKKFLPTMAYLESLGMDKEQCINTICRYPQLIASKREKIEEKVAYFLELGVTVENVRKMIPKAPPLLGMSVEKNIKPTMAYLESLGMDKERCIKVLCRYPQLITLKRENIEERISYFMELGITAENVRKMIPRAPGILKTSVEKKLKSTTKYFLSKGFTIEVLQTMVVKFPNIYFYSLTKSLIPKWEFFLEMGHPASDLANFPQYFGYSLEGRIKPRHKLAMENGVRPHLSRLLNTTNKDFGVLLEKLVSAKSVNQQQQQSHFPHLDGVGKECE